MQDGGSKSRRVINNSYHNLVDISIYFHPIGRFYINIIYEHQVINSLSAVFSIHNTNNTYGWVSFWFVIHFVHISLL